MATQKKSAKKTPWEKPAPKDSDHASLSDSQKKQAKSRAKKAGRPYPNLVDNMAAKKAAPKKAASQTAPKKATPKKAPLKKTAPEKTGVNKTPAKKTTAKASGAKKSITKKSQ